MSRHDRILVVRTDRVGDVVLATPLIRALRSAFPSAHLAAMVRPYTRGVLDGNPYLDEVLVDDPAGEHAGRAGFWRQVRALRGRRFDTALLLLPTERLAWMLFCAGIGTRVGVGTRLYQVLTGMRSVSRRKYVPLRHEADYCLDLGRAIGVRSEDLSTEVFLTDEERRAARERLEAARRGGARAGDSREGEDAIGVGVHPGSGRSAPNWRVERYVELAERLLTDERVRIVLTGSPAETALAVPFARLDRSRVVDLVGKLSLRELMGVLSQESVLVSASTGPMHLAAALRVPTVSMFCPISACSPELWGPKGNHADVVLPPEGYCRVRCPGDPHVCEFEGGIDPGAVFERVRRLLSPSAEPAARTT
ncbi:MAG: glycosyltransferase family 9 protein [bacterium]